MFMSPTEKSKERGGINSDYSTTDRPYIGSGSSSGRGDDREKEPRGQSHTCTGVSVGDVGGRGLCVRLYLLNHLEFFSFLYLCQ